MHHTTLCEDASYTCNMRIGLISDTHGMLDDRVLHHFRECDEIWHAGDIGTSEVTDRLANLTRLRAVYGNIDGHELRLQFPEHQRWNCEGVEVWITHIGGQPGRYATHVREALRTNPPDVFICGHSHLCLVQRDPSGKFLYVNPGAAGTHGFHKIRTIIRFSISGGRMHDLEVIELGPRATLISEYGGNR